MSTGKKSPSKNSVKPNMTLFSKGFDASNEACKTAINALTEEEDISTSISAIKNKCMELSAGSRKQHREVVLLVYASAYLLKNNPDLFEKFCHHPQWSDQDFKHKPKLGQYDQALRFLLKLLIDINNKDNQKKLSLYFRALNRPFNDNISYRELDQLLRKHGGLQGLAKHNAAVNKSLKTVLDVQEENQPDFRIGAENDAEGDEGLDFGLGKDNMPNDEQELDFSDYQNSSKDDASDFDLSDNQETVKSFVSNKDVTSFDSGRHGTTKQIFVSKELKASELKLLGSSLKKARLDLKVNYSSRDFSIISIDFVRIHP